MPKQILLLFLMSLATCVYSQEVVESLLSDVHQRVKGTKVSLIPPNGFTVADNFSGFQQSESGSSMMVIEVPTSFEEIKDGFTKEALLSKGVVLKNTEAFKLDTLDALLMTGTQSAQGVLYRKLMLVFGNDKVVVLVTCAYPDHLPELEPEIRKSLSSVILEPDLELDPYDGIDFFVDTNGSLLRFAKNIATAVAYSRDGLFPTESEDKSSLIVAKSFSDTIPEDRKLFAINRIKQQPFDLLKIDSVLPITIDGISGYEIFANAAHKTSGDEYNIYQVILFSDALYYIFLGTSMPNDDKMQLELKRLVATFYRK